MSLFRKAAKRDQSERLIVETLKQLGWSILPGDVREQLATLPDGCVQTCVTSPPYWGLRDYGHAGQIGLEPTPDAYVQSMVAVFAEVRRVLADDGTLWLNLGDSYAQNAPGGKPSKTASSTLGPKRDGLGAENAAWQREYRPRDVPPGLKSKDLCGIPWRVAFALQADGWYLRSDIIWSKPNPMPESVTDRPTKAHEYIFLLSKSARYYYAADAVAEPYTNGDSWIGREPTIHLKTNNDRADAGGRATTGSPFGRNKRSVWHVATQPFPEAHFATYPEKLIEPCILAGSRIGDTVLDPFCGSGTTGAVAIRHQRNFIGCELNPEYIRIAERRIGGVAPLFTVAGDDVLPSDGVQESLL
jgi:DNA modification methylase